MILKLRRYLTSIWRGESKPSAAAKLLLISLSGCYYLGWRIKSWFMARFIRRKHLPAAIISVGNITVGGTGKTPFVMMLAKYLKNKRKKIAILSRGYKRKKSLGRGDIIEKGLGVVSTGREMLLKPEEAGDEPYMMAKYVGVPVLVSPNRVKTGQYAIDNFQAEILLLDDGFSYYPLPKNLNIVLIDATSPFGNHYLLPYGALREPLGQLKQADVLALTKTNLVSRDETDLIITRLKKYNPAALIIECVHQSVDLINLATGEIESLSFIKGKEIVALSSIGAPETFEKMLIELGAIVVKTLRYPDHHYYTRDDFIEILEAAEYNLIVTTEKDTTRFKNEFWNLEKISRVNFFSLRIEMKIVKGEAEWHKKLRQLVL